MRPSLTRPAACFLVVTLAAALASGGCGARTGMLADDASPGAEPEGQAGQGGSGQAGSGQGGAGQAGAGQAGAGQAGAGQAGAGQAGAGQAGSGQAGAGQAGQAGSGHAGSGPSLDGLWTGPLTTGGISQPPVMYFHTRKGGKVLGYLMGGAHWRQIESAKVSGSSLTLTSRFGDKEPAAEFTVEGTFDQTSFTGTAKGQSQSAEVTWKRLDGPLEETRLVVFTGPPDSPAHRIDFGVLRSGEAFVSGSYHTVTGSCDFISCGGRVTSFAQSGAFDDHSTVSIGYRFTQNDGCVIDGSISMMAPLVPPTIFQGSYQQTGCDGVTQGGPLSGAFAGHADDASVAKMLSTLGRLADDQESAASFAAPYPPVSSAYLHNGLTASGLLSSLSLEVSTYSNIQVDIDSITVISTGGSDLESPPFALPAGVVYHERRAGTKAGKLEVFRDITSDVEPSLRYMRDEAGAWVFIGNQAP